MIEFTVPGIPVAQPRQRTRVANFGGRMVAQIYTPAKHPANEFKAAVRNAFPKGEAVSDQPLQMLLRFVFPRPASKTRKRGDNPRLPKTSKPDCDNLAKTVMDALNGIAYRDDSQVWNLTVEKIIGLPGETSRVDVVISFLIPISI